ncbi:MAG: electron transport complex protein RnfG [Paraglaciecola sp.]|jgi:electron transport complex protein RnfG
MTRSIIKNGLILALFAILTTGLIATTFFATKDQIDLQRQQKLITTLDALVPPESYNNSMQNDCVIVYSREYLGSNEAKHIYRATQNGQAVAAVIETTAPDGYSGRIELLVGVEGQGQVTAVRVLKHRETPGLGDKVDLRISDWILSFSGKTLTTDNDNLWAVKKDGGQFDQFTGATITPRSVVKAVKRAVQYYQIHQTELFSAANACDTPVTL